MSYQVFVYGTLKPGERAYPAFCEAYVVSVQPAVTVGRVYHLPMGYPAMTLEEGRVMGVCLTFEEEAVLSKLDDFEEYDPYDPEESLYQRLRRPVTAADGTALGEAWLYVMPVQQVRQLNGIWLPEGYWSEASTVQQDS